MEKKKWLSAMASSVLVLSLLAGCSSGGNSPAPSSSAAPAESGSPEAEPRMTLTFWDLDENATQTSVGVEAIKERFNIDIDYITTTREAQKERLNLLIVSNEIPDWWKEPNFTDYDKLLQQDVAAAIPQELIEEHMPKYVAWLKKYLGDDPFKYVRRDGKLYALPVLWDLGTDGIQLGFREDWLRNVGIDKTPETLEEMEEALTRFRNNDPDQNGEKDTYGMTASAESINLMFTSVFGAFDAIPNIFREKDGVIVRGEIEPGAKQALEVLNRWYKNDLIDPEFVVNKGANVEDKILTGKAGVVEYYWWAFLPGAAFLGGEQWYDKLRSDNPDFNFAITGGVKGPEGHYGMAQYNPAHASGVMFGKQLEQDEAKMIKYMQVFEATQFDPEIYSLMNFGVEGTHWQRSSTGTVEFIEPYTDEQERRKAGIGSLYSMSGSFNDYDFQTSFTAEEDLRELAATTRAQGTPNIDILAPFVKPVYNENQDRLLQLTMTTFIDFITGRKSLDEFDKFVEEWKSMGGTAVLEEAQQVYEQYLKN